MRVWEIVLVKFGMNNRVGSVRSCFGIKLGADASKLTIMVIAEFEVMTLWLYTNMFIIIIIIGNRGNLA